MLKQSYEKKFFILDWGIFYFITMLLYIIHFPTPCFPHLTICRGNCIYHSIFNLGWSVPTGSLCLKRLWLTLQVPWYMAISSLLFLLSLIFSLGRISQDTNEFLKCLVSPLLTLRALIALGYISGLKRLLDPADMLLLLQKYSS